GMIGSLRRAIGGSFRSQHTPAEHEIPDSPLKLIDLNDFPTSYSGQGGKLLGVKTDESGVEFVPGIPDVVTGGRNVGTGVNVFKTKDNAELIFRSLKAGSGVTITPTADELTIAVESGEAVGPGYRIVTEFTSAAIQAAINDIGTQGGTVFLPEGTYDISSTIVIPVKVNGASLITLRGAGEGTRLRPSTSVQTLIRVEGTFSHIEDIRFVNTQNRSTRAIMFGNGTSTSGLQEGDAFHAYVERCWFESFPQAIYCWDFQAIYVNRNLFIACTTSFRSEENGMGSKIVHNYILGGGPCIYFSISADNNPSDGIPPQQAEGVFITHNDIHPTSGDGIVFKGGLSITIADNMIGEVSKYPDGTAGWGVILDGTVHHPARPEIGQEEYYDTIAFASISHNWIGGAWESFNGSGLPKGAGGIRLIGTVGNVRDVRIIDNTIAGFSVYGIDLSGSNVLDTKVSLNKFHNIFTADLSVNGAKRTLVQGNTFDNEKGLYSIIEHGNDTQSLVVNNTIFTLKADNSPKAISKATSSLYQNNRGDDLPLYTLGDYSRGSRIRGALLKMGGQGANVPISNNTQTTLSWVAAEWDTEGCWSSSFPSIVTVPAWAKSARVTANVRYDGVSATGDRDLQIAVNGTTPLGVAGDVSFASGSYMRHVLHVQSGWMPVSPNDQLSVWTKQTSGQSINIAGGNFTWLQVEFA
ncbi:glycosyl hydrolase family 28-related protein, partial [Azospirillum sp. SYSU D00513]|uniref:glycosyl hydrolase family 28-related protein n=1 Tax=Azospirillum sp. SYSU D00513 TaxID=2812561 RepID=UPI001A976572